MKKILLLMGLMLTAAASFSQVVFYVFPPAQTAGSYTLQYANDPQFTQSWNGLPDMQDPANNVTDTLALAYDGTEPFDDICEDIVNPEEINGKIAVLWRGACTFVSKAQKCQEAGAVAVVIVNHSGEPVGMNGGSEIEINIPVIMISTAAGEVIRDEINSGATLTALIGQIQGEFDNNVGTWEGDYLRFQQGAHRENSASLNDELQLSTWVHNFGTAEMSEVSLHAVINNGTTDLYDETSAAPVAIPAGDSAFISLPNYTGGLSEANVYTLTYDVQTGVTDEFNGDNTRVLNINVNESKYALCRVDENQAPVVNAGGVQPNGMGSDDTYSLCIAYRESNALASQVDGISFRAVTNSGDSLTGALMTVAVYEWADDFVDLNDDNLAFDFLDDVASKDYEYVADLQNENIYVPFDNPYYLQNDMRYLFCVSSYTNTIFLGTDNAIDYDQNINTYLQPLTVLESSGNWNAVGFGTDRTASIVASLSTSEASVGENKIDEQLVAYPNPAANEITIPFSGSKQVVAVDVYDVSGKLVLSQTMKQTSPNVLKMDISELETGYYSFKALFENGKSSTFNVSVSK